MVVEGWREVLLEGCRPGPDGAKETCSAVAWVLHPSCCCCLLVSSPCSEGPSQTHLPRRSSCPERGRRSVDMFYLWVPIEENQGYDQRDSPSCLVWRGCRTCADVWAAQGRRLEEAEEQLWGSLGSCPSGLLAHCGAGLDKRQGTFNIKSFTLFTLK